MNSGLRTKADKKLSYRTYTTFHLESYPELREGSERDLVVKPENTKTKERFLSEPVLSLSEVFK